MNDKARKSASGGQEAKTRRNIDWDAVARDYRLGQFTLREMAEKHGCSHQAIAKRAKEQGWTQDLGEQIKQATNAKLVANLVNQQVASGGQAVANVVLAAAEINTNVILGHRKGLNEITQVRNMLLAQVGQAAASLPDLAEVIEMVRNPDDNGIDRANDALRKALGRSALIDDLKKLAEVDEKVRKGEREAFNISSEADKTASPTDAVAAFLAELSARGSRLPISKPGQ